MKIIEESGEYYLEIISKSNAKYEDKIVAFFKEYHLKKESALITGVNQLKRCKEPDSILYADLSDAGIENIPEKLYKFKNLKALDLSDNQFEFFDKINVFTELEALFLRDCKNLKEIPLGIGALSELTSIDITSTKIKKLPNEIFELKKLTGCNLSDNKLKVIPSEISKWKHLIRLDLWDNEITSIKNNLDLPKSLWSLDLSNNPISELCLNFDNLKNLNDLDISDIILKKLDEKIYNLINLEYLNIQGIEMTTYPNFTRFPKLKNIVLGHSRLEVIPIELYTLTSLTNLSISGRKLKISDSIGNLENLELLDLNECGISYLPKSIGQLFKLEYLHLNDNKIKDIPNEICNLKNLISLNIDSSEKDIFNKLTSLPSAIGNLENLEFLSLKDNKISFLPSSIGNLKKLRSIDISDNELQTLPIEFADLSKLTAFYKTGNSFQETPEFKDFGLDEIFYYLNKERGIGKYSFIWKIPYNLQTAFQQYLNFFNNYLERSIGIKIRLDINKTDEGLELITEGHKDITIQEISKYLEEYVSFARENIEYLKKDVKTDKEIELLVLKLEMQINHFKQQVKQYEFENKYLKTIVDKVLETHVEFVSQLKLNPGKDYKNTFTKETQQALELKNEIGKGKIEKVIEELLLLTKESDTNKYNEITVVLGRYSRITMEKRLGLIKDDVDLLEINKINKTLLDLIDELFNY